jgi:hypothetical protein
MPPNFKSFSIWTYEFLGFDSYETKDFESIWQGMSRYFFLRSKIADSAVLLKLSSPVFFVR